MTGQFTGQEAARGRASVRRTMQQKLRCPMLLLCLTATLAVGCSREWYRDQADEDVACLVEEKATPEWGVPFQSVEMDPRSRFHDVYDKVNPPMPPDDPTSHELMHYVDDKDGWDKWHKNGDITDLENPDWQALLGQYVPVDDRGRSFSIWKEPMRLAKDSFDHLAGFSGNAVPVRARRQHRTVSSGYSILWRSGHRLRRRSFFNSSTRSSPAASRPGGSSFDVGTETDIQLRRRWRQPANLSSDSRTPSSGHSPGATRTSRRRRSTSHSCSHCLRAGGRQIALETLTIAERTLLANMRAFAHFRQGFYTNIAIGRTERRRPLDAGGFSGASGFQASAARELAGSAAWETRQVWRWRQAGGGAGSAGAGVTGSGFAGGGAGSGGGFIGLLQANQQIRNTESSLAAQQQQLQLLEAHLDAGLIDIAQVDQFRQSIETERANLLQSRNGLQNQLEGFKTGTLGLPPRPAIVLDETLIEPFQFLDPEIAKIQADLSTLSTHSGVGNGADRRSLRTTCSNSRHFDFVLMNDCLT